jgi:hypothetical protein
MLQLLPIVQTDDEFDRERPVGATQLSFAAAAAAAACRGVVGQRDAADHPRPALRCAQGAGGEEERLQRVLHGEGVVVRFRVQEKPLVP